MKNNLVEELFDKSKAYRMGILCTYSLNIDFLENYLLKLDGLSNCTNLCVFTDRKVYNSHFDLNSISRSRWINKRYLLTPINTSGVFHPKLYVLASEKEVRIGIGSANLTREGLAGNLEIASVFVITEKDKAYAGLLKECLSFLGDVAMLSGSTCANEGVNEFIEYIDKFMTDEEGDLHLINNLNISIASQVVDKLKNSTVNSIYAISPFYDKNLSAHKFFLKQYPNAEHRIYIQQGKSNFPVENYHVCKQNTKVYIYKQQDRYMHGKALIFKTTEGIFLLTGSANYTSSALLSSKKTGNIETSLFGKISNDICIGLLEPDGMKATLLKEIQNLKTTPIFDLDLGNNHDIDNWLIEAFILNNQLNITLNESVDLIPKKIIINDNNSYKYNYTNYMTLDYINKSDVKFIHIEGENSTGEIVLSSKVWVINLNKNHEISDKKKPYVNNPMQLRDQLRNIIENGTEQELIDYLLMFNIPLDLVINNIGNRGLKPIASKGNVFGELISQRAGWWKNSNLNDAVKSFLESSYNKLCSHYHNIQLNKLGNFMLIMGTMFGMMEVINDYIVSTHRKNPIEANDWRIIREYYDLFLEYINDTLELVWLSDDEYPSFERMINDAIKQDQQKLLGNIVSFKDFIQKMGYEIQFDQCYKVSKKIIHSINIYIEKGKIRTSNGTIVAPVLANNGIKDQYIINRDAICRYIITLIKEN